MAQKQVWQQVLTTGTMQQEVEIAKLRKEIAPCEAVIEADKLREKCRQLSGGISQVMKRMRNLLQDALNLKLILCDVNSDARERLDKIHANEMMDTPQSLAEKMDIVFSAPLADERVLGELIQRGIGVRETRICSMLKLAYTGKTITEKKLYEIASMTYQLALLKSFASQPEVGKQLMKSCYSDADNLFDVGFIETIIAYSIAAKPSTWAANLKTGLASIAAGFASLNKRMGELGKELDAAGSKEAKARERLAAAGYDLSALDSDKAWQKFVCDAEKQLAEKRPQLVSLIKEVVSKNPESNAAEFDSLDGKELKHLAAFWEAFSEHPSAAWKLSRIYFGLKEWAAAHKWAEAEVDRSFAELDMDAVRYALEFLLKICKAEGDSNAIKDAQNRLSAHLAVCNPPITPARMFEVLKKKG